MLSWVVPVRLIALSPAAEKSLETRDPELNDARVATAVAVGVLAQSVGAVVQAPKQPVRRSARRRLPPAQGSPEPLLWVTVSQARLMVASSGIAEVSKESRARLCLPSVPRPTAR